MARAAEGGRIICTMADWSAAIAAASRTIRMWCCAAGVCPKEATRFLRGLSAVVAAERNSADPSDYLDFAEKRSLDRFLQVSGPLMNGRVVISVSDYCRQQHFICHPRILAELPGLVTSGDTANGA
jgi:hypothetical protein